MLSSIYKGPVMSENRFDASRAHEEPEFGTFVEAVAKFVSTKRQAIESIKSNALEVSCILRCQMML